MALLALGGSIGTPEQGLTADVIVVEGFEELEAEGDAVQGKIVLFNAPFTSYGETVRYRGLGAIEAARAGAVASLIRSVTPHAMRVPHTGGMRYDPEILNVFLGIIEQEGDQEPTVENLVSVS